MVSSVRSAERASSHDAGMRRLADRYREGGRRDQRLGGGCGGGGAAGGCLSRHAPRSSATVPTRLRGLAAIGRHDDRGEALSPPRLPDIIRTVRIGIDARKLHDFGIGNYIRNLLRHLARLDRQTEFVVLCRPDDCGAVTSLGENFRAVPETVANYSIAEQIKIPLALRRER